MTAVRPAMLVRRVRRGVTARVRAARFRRLHPRPRGGDVITVGDLGYGGYQVPAGLLGPGSVVVSAGAGTDVSFECLLVARFGCRVHLLDPVPAARDHVRTVLTHEPRVSYECAALWSHDTELSFHAPAIADHVSHSATDMHHTPVAFTAPARSLASLREQHGWSRVDMLKISAEGAEFAILDALLADARPVGALCVEFAQPVRIRDVDAMIDRLHRGGYELLDHHIRAFGWKATFAATRRSDPRASRSAERSQ